VVAIGLSAGHSEVEAIRATGLPIVLVDSDDLPEHSSVVVDDEAGARAAADHLISLGHRDVLVLAVEAPEHGAAQAEGVTARRLRGYRGAFAAAGAPISADHVAADRASIEGGAAAFDRAWALGLRPTAILAMSDAMAVGAVTAARALGLRIPGDLSVVGFDDIDLAAHVDPPLTTVHQPIRQKGAEAVRLLLAAMDQGVARRPEHLRLDTRLVVRGSTGPARFAPEVRRPAAGDPAAEPDRAR
jgi:LacI family transcriptional regulator